MGGKRWNLSAEKRWSDHIEDPVENRRKEGGEMSILRNHGIGSGPAAKGETSGI